MLYHIKVTQTCDQEELDYDDRQEFGENGKGEVVCEQDMHAESEDEALDLFHESVPISNLEHFDIECELAS